MAGKHQIWSSNKKTRRRARRCWRRQNRERLRGEALQDEAAERPDEPSAESLKAGPLVYATQRDIGTPLGPLLEEAVEKSREDDRRERAMTTREFAAMVGRWNGCSAEDFHALMPHLPAGSRDEEYHRFVAMPLDYFLSLEAQDQERFVEWFRGQ